MTTISTEELQRDLTVYLERIEAGETLIITRANEPVAEIKPLASALPSSQRPWALAAGDFILPSNFDEPLPETFLDLFEQ